MHCLGQRLRQKATALPSVQEFTQGTSLVAQYLRLHAPNAGAQV